MRVLIIGASRGLGKAFVQGLGEPGDTLIGVSRRRPHDVAVPDGVQMEWIEADLASPVSGAVRIAQQAPQALDVLIYNLGIWEDTAFSDDYRFTEQTDAQTLALVDTNLSATLLVLKRLVPRLLGSARPQVILTGSTSGLRQSGRPEVAFGATKFALNGIADSLRESYRQERLAVTSLQLGYLNTEDALDTPRADAATRGDGTLVPVHDVVAIVRTVLRLSPASFVRELILPAIQDERF